MPELFDHPKSLLIAFPRDMARISFLSHGWEASSAPSLGNKETESRSISKGGFEDILAAGQLSSNEVYSC